ncbi:MAG TPA: hypothetical protein VJJ73_01485 [Candidatus Paceibacterota bacterium]
MNKNTYIFVVIVVVIAFLAMVWQYKHKGDSYGGPLSDLNSGNTDEQSANVSPEPSPREDKTSEGAKEHIVTLTEEGFSPTPLTIKVGDTVTFRNESSREAWPASAMHPTHTVYPGSDIKKCGGSESGNIFDACESIPGGRSWSFKFNVVGTWGYHDHMNARNFGKVIVQ